MNEDVKEFGLFVWLVIKKLTIWLVFILGIKGLISWVPFLRIEIPASLFWLVACIGLIWVSFRLYKEQLKSVPSGKELIKVKRPPKISVLLAEGNQFSYHLPDWGVDDTLGKLPKGRVELHLKVVNDGYSDVEVLSIRGNFHYHQLWFVNYQIGVFDNEQKTIEFPFTLPAHSKWLGDLFFTVEPNPTLNQAQIKDRLSKYPEELRFLVGLEFRDASDQTRRITLKKSISSESLVEMYIKRLREHEKLKKGGA